ncbi:hypothetical protein IVB69_00995 [Flavobacterium sp. J49]|uniref:hypothetical protein n=1 Tax=Flavobacterium sp. J49 TaxID=2718534 RepID=UPI001594C571|nr:hypothetical protein [Flavobacterium sp. J49]MBF6640044.1 hypothetical protein [Flavobacterium sp. J49]NIC01289.1 hypothetical protein [Flavobacterium sp. J49]
MKSNLFICSLLTVSFVVTSCKKEEETTTSSDAPKEIVMPRVQSIPAQTYTQQPAIQNVAPTQNQTATASQTLTPNPQAATKKGMNPPHGQPGHRCDIAVGAPLNSPPGNNNQPKIGSATTQQIDPSKFTTQTTTSTPQPAGAPAILNPDAAQTTTAPGMNPPHGQPGHQCGIAVGAPLPK